MTSIIKADAMEAASGTNTDLTLTGKGSGVVNLEAGSKLGGTALTSTFNPYVTPGTSGNLLTSNGSAWTSATPAAGGAWTLIGTSVASSSASLTVTGLDSTYDMYGIGLSDLVAASATNTAMVRLGDSGGIDSGSSDYAWARNGIEVDGTVANGGDTADNAIDLSVASDVYTTNGLSGMLFLGGPADSAAFSQVTGTIMYMRGATGGTLINIGGYRLANIAHDRVQFLFASGNIVTGRLTVWGINHA